MRNLPHLRGRLAQATTVTTLHCTAFLPDFDEAAAQLQSILVDGADQETHMSRVAGLLSVAAQRAMLKAATAALSAYPAH